MSTVRNICRLALKQFTLQVNDENITETIHRRWIRLLYISYFRLVSQSDAITVLSSFFRQPIAVKPHLWQIFNHTTIREIAFYYRVFKQLSPQRLVLNVTSTRKRQRGVQTLLVTLFLTIYFVMVTSAFVAEHANRVLRGLGVWQLTARGYIEIVLFRWELRKE